MVVRANRHPHPALTCLVRNLDYDQNMIGSCSGEHHGLVAMESQESATEQAPGGGVQREGHTGGEGTQGIWLWTQIV